MCGSYYTVVATAHDRVPIELCKNERFFFSRTSGGSQRVYR